jgi:hypothetical protein
MAFPGELNINYYRGDTYDFNVYPKKTDGTVFDLSNYGTVAFTIAEVRGKDGVPAQLEAEALVSDDNTYIACQIPPSIGRQLSPATTYAYDIQIQSTSPAKTYTVLTGTITVTEEVSGANLQP